MCIIYIMMEYDGIMDFASMHSFLRTFFWENLPSPAQKKKHPPETMVDVRDETTYLGP